VLLEVSLSRSNQLDGGKFKSSLFEPGDDRAYKTTLDTYIFFGKKKLLILGKKNEMCVREGLGVEYTIRLDTVVLIQSQHLPEKGFWSLIFYSLYFE
jgi:hypothetical protein